MSHGVTPKQFESIYNAAEVIRYKKGTPILRQGEVMRHVFLVAKGHTFASSLGRRVSAASVSQTEIEPSSDDRKASKGAGGAWAGEMSFLEQYWQKEQAKVQPMKKFTTKDKDGNDSVTAVADENPTFQKQGFNDLQKQQPKEAGKDQRVEDETEKAERQPSNGQSPRAVTVVHKKTFKYEDHPLTRTASNPKTTRSLVTIVATDDCTVLRWSHADMEELMATSPDMRSALTRAMTAAIVGKVIHFTVSRAHSSHPTWPSWLGDWTNSDAARIEVSGAAEADEESNSAGEPQNARSRETIPTTVIKRFS